MKTTIYILIALAVLVGGFFVFNNYMYNEKQADPVVTEVVTDPKNATYSVNGEMVTLNSGVSEVAVPNSSAKVVTRYFGNEIKTDLNGDGRKDVFFLITQETGGSGVFYYGVGALATEGGYMGTYATLIGDRIAPQSTTKGEGSIVVVNYAVRKAGEVFTTPPSVGKSLWLKLDPKTLQFGEVMQNFEGEADPKKMSLTMKEWSWFSFVNEVGTKIVPKEKGVFSITFKADKTFNALTDCNVHNGTYSVSGNKITFTKTISTMMACPGESQEEQFKIIFENSATFEFTSKGELILTPTDGGKAVFR